MGQKISKISLFHAIDCNKSVKVRKLILQKPFLVNAFFDSKQRGLPLTRAAWLGNEELVELLLEFGADLNKQLSSGYSAIFYAAEKGHANLVRKLLRKPELNLNLRDNQGMNVLDIAISKGFYNIAITLKKAGLEPKSLGFYSSLPNNFVGFRINYGKFLENLNDEVEMSVSENNKVLFEELVKLEEKDKENMNAKVSSDQKELKPECVKDYDFIPFDNLSTASNLSENKDKFNDSEFIRITH